MIGKMELRRALACLAHPWSLIALAVLGVNDHVWKGLGPGWLTGKLSDVAGLFFAPYLALAGLALLGAGRRRASRATAIVAFAWVAVWFAAAKTIAPVHAATVALASALVGPVVVIRDATDLLALVALVPSWRLYRRVADAPPRPLGRILQAPALCAAVVLTAATSRPREPGVARLHERDGEVIAEIRDVNRDSEIGWYASVDGVEWRELPERPPGIAEGRAVQREVTTTETPPRRYRLRDADVLIEAAAGWQVAWRMPVEREDFMRLTKTCPRSATEIAALPGARGVIAAFGCEGVVVGDTDGPWSRHAVGPVRPSPTHAELRELPNLLTGHTMVGVLGALHVVILTSILWWFIRPRAPVPPAATHEPRAGLVARIRARLAERVAETRWDPGLVVLSLFALISLGVGLAISLRVSDLGPFVIFLFHSAALLFLVLGWQRARTISPESRAPSRRIAVGAATGWLTTLVAIVLWALGWIVSRSAALSLTAAAIVVISAIAARRPG